MELHNSSEQEAPEKVTKLFSNNPLAHRINRRSQTQAGLDGLGRFKAQVFAQPAAGDQHPNRQSGPLWEGEKVERPPRVKSKSGAFSAPDQSA